MSRIYLLKLTAATSYENYEKAAHSWLCVYSAYYCALTREKSSEKEERQ